MARETKIGFLLVIVLLGAFGYVVYRKLGENPDPSALVSAESEGSDAQSDATSDADIEKPIDADALAGAETEAGASDTEADPFGDQVEPVQEERPATRTASAHRRQRRPVEIPDLGDASDSLEQVQSEELGLQRTPPQEIQEIEDPGTGDEEMAQLASNPQEPEAAGAELVPSLEEPSEPDAPSLTPSLDSTPVAKLPGKIEEEDDEQRLGGFEEAPDSETAETAMPDNSPQVTLEAPQAEPPANDVTEEDNLERRLGGYVGEDVTVNRAISRTRVTRSAVPVPTQLPEYQDQEHSHKGHRGGARLHGIDLAAADTPSIDEPLRNDGPTPILPRSSGDSTVIKRRNGAVPPTISSPELGAEDGFEAESPRKEVPTPGAVPVPQPEPVAQVQEHELRQTGNGTRHEPRHETRHDMYTVKPHDNFWTISKQQYGTARLFMALTRYNHNRVSDPGQLRPGMQVATPPREVLEREFPDLIDKSPREPRSPGNAEAGHDGHKPQAGYFVGPSGESLYRIGAADTLTGISQRHLGRSSRWTEIYDRNRDVLKRPDALQIGTVIRLPPDASRLSVVPDATERR